MGVPIVIGGTPQTLTGNAAETYLAAFPLFRVWYSDPARFVSNGNPYGDSPTPDVYAVQIEPSYLWAPTDTANPLQIPAGGKVWILPEKIWRDVYVNSGYMLDGPGLAQSWFLTVSASGAVVFWGSDPALGNGSGGWGEFLKDFGDGALKVGIVAGVIVGGFAAAGMLGTGAPVLGGVPSTVAMGSTASEWAVATAGMGEGMVAVVSGAESTFTFSGVMDAAVKTGSTVVQAVDGVAKAVVATHVAVDTIQAAVNAPIVPAKQTPAPQSAQSNGVLLGGLILAAFIF